MRTDPPTAANYLRVFALGSLGVAGVIIMALSLQSWFGFSSTILCLFWCGGSREVTGTDFDGLTGFGDGYATVVAGLAIVILAIQLIYVRRAATISLIAIFVSAAATSALSFHAATYDDVSLNPTTNVYYLLSIAAIATGIAVVLLADDFAEANRRYHSGD